MRAMLRRLTRAACISVHAPDGSHSYVAIFFILVLPNTCAGPRPAAPWPAPCRSCWRRTAGGHAGRALGDQRKPHADAVNVKKQRNGVDEQHARSAAL